MAEKLTKTEAVRLALAELGNDAMPLTIQAWVKEKLGVVMTTGHVSTTKGEILRGGKKETTTPAPAPAKPFAPRPVAGGKLTKNEAVRLALLELGKDADRVQIQGFVKDHFGIEMNLDHISTARSMALRKLAEDEQSASVLEGAAPKAEKLLPFPGSEPASKPQSTPITKIEAVRLAVVELGSEAKVSEIQNFLIEHFNLEITPGHAKTAKGKVLRDAANAMSVKTTPTKSTTASATEKGILLEDIQNLKALLNRIGPTYLQTLVEVIAK